MLLSYGLYSYDLYTYGLYTYGLYTYGVHLANSSNPCYLVMAYIVMAYIAMAYIVKAYIAMAYIAMAYIAMAYTLQTAETHVLESCSAQPGCGLSMLVGAEPMATTLPWAPNTPRCQPAFVFAVQTDLDCNKANEPALTLCVPQSRPI